ncbi:MAG: ABC transporter ATP-binding protein [Candidatus Scalinduaceae bacterium]
MSDITKQQAVQMTSNNPKSQTPNPQSAIRNPDIAISVRNLSKKYQLYETPKHRLKEALHPFKKKYHREFWAVRNVSFEAMQGETVGIIGRNGSGKSTLLQMICGTLTPTQGDINVNGRVSALLELGAGFNPQFTGRENVYINGAILGLSREEIEERYQVIVDFAEIGDFIDQPVKNYSSGMYIRLAFAVAINVDPEIMVVDEALSVGDAKFQRKCYAKLEEFRKSGKTILFVSHAMDTINLLCDRAMLLEKGQIIEQGVPKEVTNLYHKMLFGEETKPVQKMTTKKNKEEKKIQIQEAKHNNLAKIDELETEKLKQLVLQKLNKPDNRGHSGEMRYGNKKAEIIDFGILDKNGNRATVLETGEKYTSFSKVLFYEDLENDDIFIGFGITTVKGVILYWTTTHIQDIDVPPQEKGNVLEVQFQITMWLAPGDYFMGFSVRDQTSIYDRRAEALHFKVAPNSKIGNNSLVNLNTNAQLKNRGSFSRIFQ